MTAALIGLLIALSVTAAPTEGASAIEGLEEIRARYDVCALGALVIVDGRVAAQDVAGTVARSSKKEVAIDARWHLGSCAKSMTATLAGVLVQRGALDWDLTVGEAFATESVEVHADYASVTLVDLLSHRAGCPSDLVYSPLWLKLLLDSDGDPAEQRRRIAAKYLGRGPAHPPRSEFRYSNVGYVIAGRMLELRGGKSYEDLLVELVFEPLGITSAGFGPPAGADDPRGHRSGFPVLADNPPGLTSAGRIHMSLEDWARYAQEHLRAARGEPTELLTPPIARRLHTPPGDAGYALGWGTSSPAWLDPPVLAHAGSNTMWVAQIFIAPQRNCAFLVTTNEGTEAARNATREAAEWLAERYAPQADVLEAREKGWVPLNRLEAGFTLRVTDASGRAGDAEPLYVACNANGWNPADPAWRMAREGDAWVLAAPRTASAERLQYKITRGSWETVEVDASLRDVSNRRAPFAAPGTTDAVVELSVPAFADQRGE